MKTSFSLFVVCETGLINHSRARILKTTSTGVILRIVAVTTYMVRTHDTWVRGRHLDHSATVPLIHV